LQAGQRRLQEAVLLIAGRAADTAQELIGREAEEARGGKARFSARTIWLAAQISTSASQIVAMPRSGMPNTCTSMSLAR